MNKSTIIRCIMAVLLTAYLVVAIVFTSAEAKNDSYRDFRICIHDVDSARFVTAEEIDRALGLLRSNISQKRVGDINTLGIERTIAAFDNVESVNCVALNNGVLRLDVVPMIPVARVFDMSDGASYYINRDGKRMNTSLQYRIDAPVVVGAFGGKFQPIDALPLLDYLKTHPYADHLVSAINFSPKGDLILVPIVKGHVVNLGDANDLDDKFSRLTVFYKNVMPAKGWEFYDTISVKWAGQVVARQHVKTERQINYDVDEDYIDDLSTMSGNATDSATVNEKQI